MHFRSFLIQAGGTLLILLLITFNLGWTMEPIMPQKMTQELLELPKSAMFIPRENYLTMHWMVSPNLLSEYSESLVPKPKKEEVSEITTQLINGAFAVSGLDFEKELSEWIGDQVSFSLFESETPTDPLDWLITLRTKDKDSAKKLLQLFWQNRSYTTSDIKTSKYMDFKLISLENGLIDSNTNHISTALVDQNLVLLTSNKFLLEKCLKASDSPEKTQLGDQNLNNYIKKLGPGVAILQASPSAMATWFGFPKNLTDIQGINGLVAGLATQESDISLKGMIVFNHPIDEELNETPIDLALLNNIEGPEKSIALLNEPSHLLNPIKESPLSKFLGPMIQARFTKLKSSAALTIAQKTNGPFLWLEEPNGWVIRTERENPEISTIDQALSNQNFTKSILSYEEDDLQFWSNFIIEENNSNQKITTKIAVLLSKYSDKNWWGENFSSLKEGQRTTQELTPISFSDKKITQEMLALGENQTKALLKNWLPWSLLKTLSGDSIGESTRGLSISIGMKDSQILSDLELSARLSLG